MLGLWMPRVPMEAKSDELNNQPAVVNDLR